MNRYSLFVQCLDKSNPARLRLVSWEKKDQKVHDTRGYQKLAQWSSAIWISGVKCKVHVCDSDRAALQLHRAAHRCFSEISQHGHHFCMKGAVVQRDFGANTGDMSRLIVRVRTNISRCSCFCTNAVSRNMKQSRPVRCVHVCHNLQQLLQHCWCLDYKGFQIMRLPRRGKLSCTFIRNLPFSVWKESGIEQ